VDWTFKTLMASNIVGLLFYDLIGGTKCMRRWMYRKQGQELEKRGFVEGRLNRNVPKWVEEHTVLIQPPLCIMHHSDFGRKGSECDVAHHTGF
jgi:hypothetical protein